VKPRNTVDFFLPKISASEALASITDPDFLESPSTSQKNELIDIHSQLKSHLIKEQKTDANFNFSNDGVHLDKVAHRLIANFFHEELFKINLPPIPGELRNYYRSRQQIFAPAWLTHTGHQRPGITPGLPLAEAQARAAQILR